MRRLLLGVVLFGLACGGTDNQTQAPAFAGQWSVLFNQSSGTMTLSASGSDGIVGTWDFGAAGHGSVAGAVQFGATISLLFADPQNIVIGDATADVATSSMTGTARTPTSANGTFSAQKTN